MPDEPKADCVDLRPVINSHTQTEYGKYDADEPLPFESNAYGWYIRACYWKQKFHRNEGIQMAVDFGKPMPKTSKWKRPEALPGFSAVDLDALYNTIRPFGSPFDNKINGIKQVREVTGMGLKESKDFVDAFMALNEM